MQKDTANQVGAVKSEVSAVRFDVVSVNSKVDAVRSEIAAVNEKVDKLSDLLMRVLD